MDPFKRSLVKTLFISCLLIAPVLLSSVATAHFSVNPQWAKNLSFYFSALGIVAFICAIFFGVLLIKSRKNRSPGLDATFKKMSYSSNKKVSKLALLSFVLSFPLFGLMSLGVTSFAGLIFGYKGLQRIHSDETLKGLFFAITGISLSIFTFSLIITGILFVGPD